jgi:tRNA U34 5-methylaminomethyl-2-thiouridine-forming methyltransferase MnmC
MNPPAFELVRLANGAHSIRYAEYGETLHPVAGPLAEARALYVDQLQIVARAGRMTDPFVIWDVGTGAGANVMAALLALRDAGAAVQVVSFDHTLEALRFALKHPEELGYFDEFAGPASAIAAGARRVELEHGSWRGTWEMHLGDFPQRLAAPEPLPAPHAIFYDGFSPARNPELWTLPLFERLLARLDPDRPCSLATYSRSTFVRAALLLAGFLVGVGEAVAGKEETTVAANVPELLGRPLHADWLARARRSHSAEPLREAVYRQAPLSPETWERLQAHPQFR